VECHTTAFDAAIPPLSARHAHEEFEDTPCLDKGFYVLMGNNHYVMRPIQQGEPEKVKAFIGWLLGAAKGYAAKLVNPGGVEVWKSHPSGNVQTVDSPVDHFGVTPRQIIRSVAQAVDELRLPHSVHIHANNLGLPGNWATTLETMRVLEGHRGHLTHIQFHDTELEAGCGIAPIEYKNTSLIHAWQWAIGLEWYLLVQDPWRVVMSTDHPNGGSFLAYPQIIRLLMDRTYRQDVLKTVPRPVHEQSVLNDLDREYSLSDIAIITRAGPARILGLKHKGHLGAGADADLTIYSPNANQETMFELPRYVVKDGQVIIEQGEIREDSYGKTLHVAPEFDRGVEPDIQKWFEESYSIQWRNYPVQDASAHDREVVA
jgi:formylmethanofuran dehydrogenase subunit A